MNGLVTKRTLSALVLTGIAALASVAHAGEAGRAALCVVEKPELHVCYREVPWSPKRVGRTETAGATPLTPWTVATMDVRKPLAIGTIDLEPGCYAWVCTADEMGRPVLDLRRLRLPEGTLPDPEAVRPLSGESLFRMPIQFDLSQGTTPHLTIELMPSKKGLRLRTRYGNGEATTTLLRR